MWLCLPRSSHRLQSSAAGERPPRSATAGGHGLGGLQGRHRPEQCSKAKSCCLMGTTGRNHETKARHKMKTGCARLAAGGSRMVFLLFFPLFIPRPDKTSKRPRPTRAVVRLTSAKSVSKSGLTSAYLKPTERSPWPIHDKAPAVQYRLPPRATRPQQSHACLYLGRPLPLFCFPE
ncbi:hypothetical protein VTI74DRAFT_7679 [Chaetomium olivicolor]